MSFDNRIRQNTQVRGHGQKAPGLIGRHLEIKHEGDKIGLVDGSQLTLIMGESIRTVYLGGLVD